MPKLNDIIKLCVGGREFKTTLSTLIADQNSMLAKIFLSNGKFGLIASKEEDGTYFIDRDPKVIRVYTWPGSRPTRQRQAKWQNF